MDLNGKDPLVDASAQWLQASQAQPDADATRPRSSGRHRTSERHRVRRRSRSRKASDVKSRIRVRVWLTCTGALIAMVIAIYIALGHGSGGEAGQLGVSAPGGFVAGRSTSWRCAAPEA